MSTAQVVIGIITWCLIFIAIAVFVSILIIIHKCRQEMQDVSALLIYNTCAGALLTCTTMCIMIASDLTTGFLIRSLGFCYAWGLIYDISQCSIYFSYCLQAMYRLFRVVFYQRKPLISYSLYFSLIVAQWLLIVALLLPPIPFKWYVPLPTEKYCLIPYTDVKAEVYHIAILYIIPLLCISTIYVWIIVFIYYSSRASIVVLAAVQRQRNLRDLIIVKRIAILVLTLIFLRFPTVIFMIYGITAGHLHPLTYSLVGLITSACLILIGLMTVYITPPLRKIVLAFFIRHPNQACVQKSSKKASQTPVAVVSDVVTSNRDDPTNLPEDADKVDNLERR